MSDNNIYSLTSSGTASTISTNSVLNSDTTLAGNCITSNGALGGQLNLQTGGSGALYNYITTPYYGYTAVTYPTYSPHYQIQLRQIQNGWIMYKDNKEFFLKSLDEVSKFYNKEEKTK